MRFWCFFYTWLEFVGSLGPLRSEGSSRRVNTDSGRKRKRGRKNFRIISSLSWHFYSKKTQLYMVQCTYTIKKKIYNIPPSLIVQIYLFLSTCICFLNILVITNEKNSIQNFFSVIQGGAGAESRTFKPAPASDKMSWLRPAPEHWSTLNSTSSSQGIEILVRQQLLGPIN